MGVVVKVRGRARDFTTLLPACAGSTHTYTHTHTTRVHTLCRVHNWYNVASSSSLCTPLLARVLAHPAQLLPLQRLPDANGLVHCALCPGSLSLFLSSLLVSRHAFCRNRAKDENFVGSPGQRQHQRRRRRPVRSCGKRKLNAQFWGVSLVWLATPSPPPCWQLPSVGLSQLLLLLHTGNSPL